MLRSHIVTTGLITAGMFMLVTASGLGFLFMFLAIVPLLMSSLSRPHPETLYSVAISSLVIAFIGGTGLLTLYAVFFGVPAWYFGLQARRQYKLTEHIAVWRPIGLAIMDITLYACVMMSVIVLYYAINTEGITVILQEKIELILADMPADYAPLVKDFSTTLNFLVFSSLAWLWVVAIYLHSWVANRILIKQNNVKRPCLAVELFPMPDGMLYLLAVAALASLIGGESMQFLGKACFITLLLPYLFLGLALIHKRSKSLPGRRFLLIFLYVFLPFQFWLSMIIACIGIALHFKQVNKRLSSDEDSSK